MKVLLLGEFSSFHLSLAHGLRVLGVDVTLASTGDYWKNIPRDVDLRQPERLKRVTFPIKLLKKLPKLWGYDVVQLIAPNFLMSTPIVSSKYFDLLKRGNDKFFLCACGMDYHYVSYALTGKLKHSVFYFENTKSDPFVSELKTLVNNKTVKKLDRKIANYCDGIIAVSNGYFTAYKYYFPDKTCYIPLPVNTIDHPYVATIEPDVKRVNFFIGLMKDRVKLKGIDRIHNVLLGLKKKHPKEVDLTIVNSVPYNEYIKLLNNSHVLCDQLYASGIGMNGLIGLSKGLIVGGCADAELYDSLGEKNNKPLVDLNTSDAEMFRTFEQLIDQKSSLKERSLKSREFVVKHHDSVKVAQQYLDFWKKMSDK
ncbi:hypothetical protein [Carboxylicivirga sp. N1Y90]|uniref:hypothetical protein n=1 Tax=Carboxylicivirga fragile TaxID=3417571 RepID=UPI003D349992|nr:glycosyltransferase [Marinilabiliaceae bacterium N1Y90]